MVSLVLSGGVGSRLWPVSREKMPKQFSSIFTKTLFEQTVSRLSNYGEVQICTGERLRGMTESSIRRNGFQVGQCYFEPIGRNTAPAIALACKYMADQGRAAEILGVFPSDHWIENEQEFGQVLKLAQECAEDGQVVTLGLKPHYPATGFGYIECKQKIFKQSGSHQAHEVNGFREKPDLATAQSFLSSGNFVWNSGMFVFKVSTLISAFEQHMPELWSGLQSLKADLSNLNDVFPGLPSESIDYGVMEKLNNQVNIPCDLGWSDLGSWDDVADLSQKNSICSNAEVVELDSKNCFAFSSEKKLVSMIDVKDLVVIDTKDALLVTKKQRTQKVKDLVNLLNENNSEKTVDHTYERRPWGTYYNTWEQKEFKTKVIEVDPKQQLSYQSHEQRSEIWIVVMGEGEVVLNDETIKVSPGSYVSIPAKSKHRMRNPNASPLVFVEVQLGDYFGEDDIVRYQDDYKRN